MPSPSPVARRSRRGARRAQQAGTTARGYGHAHQKLRARLAPLVATGAVACARCGNPIAPTEQWDLGHDDLDRERYSGPEHARCNRATSGRAPGAVAAPKRVVRVPSRVW